MRLALLPVLLAAGSLALAGCVGPSSEPPVQPASEDPVPEGPSVGTGGDPAPGAGLMTFPFAGRVTAGAGHAQVGYVMPTGGQDAHVFTFPVDAGATALVAELRWSDAAHDLDITLESPSCTQSMGAEGTCLTAGGGSVGQGDSPVRLVVVDPMLLAEAGDWTFEVWAKNALNAEFTAVVSVFYGAEVTEDYTAMG